MIHKGLVRLLPECNDVPFTCNVLLSGPWLPSSGSWIPAQDADTSLLKQTVWHAGVETVLWLVRGNGRMGSASEVLPQHKRVRIGET